MARHKQTASDNDGGLFGDMLQEDTAAVQSGPVTVLGLTFADDDERRAFFRSELRAKLPELRKIEGFPIGSDDDIINLSDPPYYTACPNPWLNDFIAKWEQEKKRLEADGLREDNTILTPYASDISEGKRNPVYDAHSYHTKVPHPAIMRYILHYSQPGDIIFDGFCGTGMTGVAAYLCGWPDDGLKAKINQEFKDSRTNIKWGERHAIVSDLSPVASLIAAEYNTPASSRQSLKELSSVISQLKSELGWMYETVDSQGKSHCINYTVWSDVFICPHCGNEFIFYNVAVKPDGKVLDTFDCPHCNSSLNKKVLEKKWISYFDYTLNEVCRTVEKVPVLINYSNGTRGSIDKVPSEKDLEVISKASSLAKDFNLTIQRMMEGSEARRNDRQGLTHVHHFYFDRTLVALQTLLSKKNLSKELRFLVNAQLINISKLNRFRPGVSFPYNPLSGTLYIGSQISEANLFVALENKLKKMSTVFSMLDAHNCVSINSATSLNLPSASVDYIFTDPPFGANISYSELNFIQESWLRLTTNYETEAVENNSHNKTKETYSALMSKSLLEFYRILKPGKWMTVEFSNTSAAIWNTIQHAISNAGFIIASVAALDKQQGSFKAVTTTTAVKQDLIISCFKPSEKMLELFKESTDTAQNVWDFVDELLSHLPVHLEKEQKTTAVVERSPKILYDRLISYYVQRGFPVPLDAKEFQDGLRERFLERDGMFFTADQAYEYESKKKATIGFEAAQTLFVSSEAEGIEWLKRELQEPKTYADLTNPWNTAQISPKKGDKIPELKTILEENFIQDEDERWRTPDPEKEADLEKIRNRRLAHEFKLIVEEVQKPKSRIKDARLEALRYGFTEAYRAKDFETIVKVAHKLPEALVMEDEVLLRYYDIAINHV
ncbi:MAG: DNA methylase [Clostridium sp.]|nr:DNA methylase [Clostridium sp.]